MSFENKEINGYKVLPIKLRASSTAQHELFIKEHSLFKQEPDKPIGRTLFVANVPPYTTEASFKRVFSSAGKIQSVTFHESPGTAFKIAYIVFATPSALAKALKLTKLEPLTVDKNLLPLGVEKWTKDYNSSICDRQQLQQQVDQFMLKYDKEEKARKRKEKEQKEDDEGWTVVTKKSRNPGISRKESVGNRLTEKLENKSKKKELKNFYTFQIRESKMNHIVQLRQKFEEDKKRINAFKQSRKFKPF